jgi:acyl CoA:acetate/3-ketoacid CoA transferase beta subunit
LKVLECAPDVTTDELVAKTGVPLDFSALESKGAHSPS